MNWYVKKADGAMYGPIGLETIRTWAAEGRVAAEDYVSRDGHSWMAAADEPLLEIEWCMDIEGGGSGPYHLGVFAEWLGAGVVAPETVVRNVRTGREARLKELIEWPTAAAETASGAVTGAAGVPIPESVTWQALARERDMLADEARKWRALQEQAEASLRRLEAESARRIRELEQEVLQLQIALEKERRDFAEWQADKKTATESAAESGDWSAAYHALAIAFRTLTDELESRYQEVHALREEITRAHAAAEERIRTAEARALEERKTADQLRRAMTEMEEAHQTVIRSLRELNDRYVQLRARRPESDPAARAAEAPAAATGPHIRLIR